MGSKRRFIGSTCFQRMNALQYLGHEVYPVDTCPSDAQRKKNHFGYRLLRKIAGPLDLASANEKILKSVTNGNIDILWIDKGLTIKATTIKAVKKLKPKCLIVGYSPDDMAASHNQSRQFLHSLSFYDVFFTTKSYGVNELEKLGCKEAIFFNNAYDPETHKPVPVTPEERLRLGGEVGFIGDYERERAEAILYLAENSIPVRVWGLSWGKKCKLSHPNMIIEGIPLWGNEYAKAICCFDINLNFLRKVNRDLQTTRSIEIPACGGFMLAERTCEHLELFEEGKEADFFGSNEELLDKVRYYLAHLQQRKQIAAAGRDRCLKSGYSNHDRLREMLNIVEQMRDKKQ